MKKCSVYTRKGDSGMTSLASGERVPKDSLRLESYGTVDELNSHLGLLLTYVAEDMTRRQIIDIQGKLFTIGGILATTGLTGDTCPITDGMIKSLENAIDIAADGLPAWRGFTLPGGCRGASQAHICRTVCRRAERRILALNAAEKVPQGVLSYINRLSDYLYIIACRLNKLNGTEEILWKKSLE